MWVWLGLYSGPGWVYTYAMQKPFTICLIKTVFNVENAPVLYAFDCEKGACAVNRPSALA